MRLHFITYQAQFFLTYRLCLDWECHYSVFKIHLAAGKENDLIKVRGAVKFQKFKFKIVIWHIF